MSNSITGEFKDYLIGWLPLLAWLAFLFFFKGALTLWDRHLFLLHGCQEIESPDLKAFTSWFSWEKEQPLNLIEEDHVQRLRFGIKLGAYIIYHVSNPVQTFNRTVMNPLLIPSNSPQFNFRCHLIFELDLVLPLGVFLGCHSSTSFIATKSDSGYSLDTNTPQNLYHRNKRGPQNLHVKRQ